MQDTNTERLEVIAVMHGGNVLTAHGVVKVADSLEEISPVDQGDMLLVTNVNGKLVAISKTN